MSTPKNDPKELKSTGKRYNSVEDLLPDSAFPVEVVKDAREHERQSRLTHQLALMRTKAGITQAQMAEHLEITQGAVSKLENGKDDDVTVKHLRIYAKATAQRIGLSVGKPLNHVESIKFHALQVRSHMKELAKLAHNDEELEKGIQAFFGEAFFNILDILSECQNSMPNGDSIQVRFEIQEPKNRLTCTAKAAGLMELAPSRQVRMA